MNEVQIIMQSDTKNGSIKLLLNGKPLPNVFAFNVNYNSRTNLLEFKGQRFATNKSGQLYVDENTKDTAMEDVNLLNLFNPHIVNRELVKEHQQALEMTMLNVYMTSFLNAKNLIKERGVNNDGTLSV
jgi:hypothetical protein